MKKKILSTLTAVVASAMVIMPVSAMASEPDMPIAIETTNEQSDDEDDVPVERIGWPKYIRNIKRRIRSSCLFPR